MFLFDTFDLQVFPPPAAAATTGKVLVFDPLGETTKMLAHAGVAAEPLRRAIRSAAGGIVVVGKRCYGPSSPPGCQAAAYARHRRRPESAGLRAGDARRARAPAYRAVAAGRVCRRAGPSAVGRAAAREDLVNLRGRSDLVEAYPEVTPGTEKVWPERGYKWGDRGVVSTFVFRKPHYAPFARCWNAALTWSIRPCWKANGAAVESCCAVDVTLRPAGPIPCRRSWSTRPCRGSGTAATRPLALHRAWVIRPSALWQGSAWLPGTVPIFVSTKMGLSSAYSESPARSSWWGRKRCRRKLPAGIEAAVRGGTTALLLPESPLGGYRFGLRSTAARLFIGQLGKRPAVGRPERRRPVPESMDGAAGRVRAGWVADPGKAGDRRP